MVKSLLAASIVLNILWCPFLTLAVLKYFTIAWLGVGAVSACIVCVKEVCQGSRSVSGLLMITLLMSLLGPLSILFFCWQVIADSKDKILLAKCRQQSKEYQAEKKTK